MRGCAFVAGDGQVVAAPRDGDAEDDSGVQATTDFLENVRRRGVPHANQRSPFGSGGQDASVQRELQTGDRRIVRTDEPRCRPIVQLHAHLHTISSFLTPLERLRHFSGLQTGTGQDGGIWVTRQGDETWERVTVLARARACDLGCWVRSRWCAEDSDRRSCRQRLWTLDRRRFDRGEVARSAPSDVTSRWDHSQLWECTPTHLGSEAQFRNALPLVVIPNHHLSHQRVRRSEKLDVGTFVGGKRGVTPPPESARMLQRNSIWTRPTPPVSKSRRNYTV